MLSRSASFRCQMCTWKYPRSTAIYGLLTSSIAYAVTKPHMTASKILIPSSHSGSQIFVNHTLSAGHSDQLEHFLISLKAILALSFKRRGIEALGSNLLMNLFNSVMAALSFKVSTSSPMNASSAVSVASHVGHLELNHLSSPSVRIVSLSLLVFLEPPGEAPGVPLSGAAGAEGLGGVNGNKGPGP